MEILYLLIPLTVLLAGVIVWAFFWSVKSGQFDDLEGPAHRILMDDDKPQHTDVLPAVPRDAKPQHTDVLPAVPRDANPPTTARPSRGDGGHGT